MRPRTKLQIEVYDLSLNLDKLSKDKKEWAFKECMLHKGFATKTRVICMDCGETFSPELVNRKRATCPHCETKLKIENTRKSTDSQREYFAIAEVHFEYQIIRNFTIHSHYKKGAKSRIYVQEILQYWINDMGKVTTIGRNHNTQGYCDSWGGDWSIRTNYRRGYYYNGDKYMIYPWKFHPSSTFKKEYRKYGINHSIVDALNFLDAIKIVPEYSKAETLLKAKQFSLLKQFRDSGGNITQYWSSIKICIRNKYKVKDASIWFDYLDLLRFFNKDMHNAHFVCPKNLKRAHDKLVDKKRKIKEAQALKLKKQRAINDQADYIKQKQKYFGLEFTTGAIKIKVLESVMQFVEEGDKLKHCLYANDYHKKENSLIFKAEVNGESVETVELCLKTFKVLQSRGKHNNHTEYNEKIVACLKANMKSVKEIANKKAKVKRLKKLKHYVEAI